MQGSRFPDSRYVPRRLNADDNANPHRYTAIVTEPQIVCVDFNGVLDDYTGWKGADHLDQPRRGARAFLEELLARGYEIVIFTTSYEADRWAWVRAHGFEPLITAITDRKPAAHVFATIAPCAFAAISSPRFAKSIVFAAHWESSPGQTR